MYIEISFEYLHKILVYLINFFIFAKIIKTWKKI